MTLQSFLISQKQWQNKYYEFRGIRFWSAERGSHLMKYAVVDLGSNTIRLSVYRAAPGGFELLFSEKETVGLVNYVHGGRLSHEGIQRACCALLSLKALLGQFGLETLHVFATASLRNIRNTGEAVREIREAVGVDVDVISGELEARLGYEGARHAADLRDGAMFDIGGGSTEILEVQQGMVLRAQSLPIGSLSLFNQCVDGIWPRKKELKAIRCAVKNALREADLPVRDMERVCGVGGTARAALKIANAWQGRQRDNRILTREELHGLTDLLLREDHRARKLVLNNCPDRIHTILPGLILMDMLAALLCRQEIYISPYGVREGYLCHKLLSAGT